jgi:hypothetical protein
MENDIRLYAVKCINLMRDYLLEHTGLLCHIVPDHLSGGASTEECMRELDALFKLYNFIKKEVEDMK